jgi:hypothetical protein
LDKFSDTIWGFPIKIKADCQVLRDVLLNDHLNAAHAQWRDGILAHKIVDVRHVPGKLNMIADGLSQQWEGHPWDEGLEDGSNWTVSEDWEANSGLINDILTTEISTDPNMFSSLQQQFANEPIFLEVIESIAQLNSEKSLHNCKRTKY